MQILPIVLIIDGGVKKMAKEESMRIDQAIEDRKDKVAIYKTLIDILYVKFCKT